MDTNREKVAAPALTRPCLGPFLFSAAPQNREKMAKREEHAPAGGVSSQLPVFVPEDPPEEKSELAAPAVQLIAGPFHSEACTLAGAVRLV